MSGEYSSEPLDIIQNTKKMKVDENTKEIVNYKNVQSSKITITEDKMLLILNDYENAMKNSGSYVTPFSIFLTTAATLGTASFNDILGLSGDMWKIIYVLVTVASFSMTVFLIIKSLKNRKNRKKENVIKKMKGEL